SRFRLGHKPPWPPSILVHQGGQIFDSALQLLGHVWNHASSWIGDSLYQRSLSPMGSGKPRFAYYPTRLHLSQRRLRSSVGLLNLENVGKRTWLGPARCTGLVF